MIIEQARTHRKYFFSDWDEAKAFERMFDGDFSYSIGGYTVTI